MLSLQVNWRDIIVVLLKECYETTPVVVWSFPWGYRIPEVMCGIGQNRHDWSVNHSTADDHKTIAYIISITVGSGVSFVYIYSQPCSVTETNGLRTSSERNVVLRAFISVFNNTHHKSHFLSQEMHHCNVTLISFSTMASYELFWMTE